MIQQLVVWKEEIKEEAQKRREDKPPTFETIPYEVEEKYQVPLTRKVKKTRKAIETNVYTEELEARILAEAKRRRQPILGKIRKSKWKKNGVHKGGEGE